MRYFELIRFLGISYFKNTTYDFINAPEFLEVSMFILNLDDILKNVIRPWYNNLLNKLLTTFQNFIDQISLINVTTFIVLIVSITIIYALVWKNFEEHLKELLKTSVDLINLIPESIKYIIVQKINEEEDSKKE